MLQGDDAMSTKIEHEAEASTSTGVHRRVRCSVCGTSHATNEEHETCQAARTLLKATH